jgi:hypothetical protein
MHYRVTVTDLMLRTTTSSLVAAPDLHETLADIASQPGLRVESCVAVIVAQPAYSKAPTSTGLPRAVPS